jgi:hypothetical protein
MISEEKNNKEKQEKARYEKVRNGNIIVKLEPIKFCINIDFLSPSNFI